MKPLPPFVKTALRYVENRLRFPRATVGSDTFIERGSRIAGEVALGAQCRVWRCEIGSASRLGDSVSVARRSRIGGSILGDGCSVEADAAIFNSTLGDHVAVQTRCELTDVSIGRCSYVGRETYLNAVRVGAFCSIGPRSLMGFGEHPVDFPSTAPAFYSPRGQTGLTFASSESFRERRRITLGSDVWVGAHVFIRDGVEIGDGAIIAAGAVVTQNVPPYTIVGGTPARVIRPRFSEQVAAALHRLRWWTWSDDELRSAQPFMNGKNVEGFLQWALDCRQESDAHGPNLEMSEKTA